MRVAFLSANAPDRDAVGNQLAEKVACLRSHGACVRVFVESALRMHPSVLPFAQVLPDFASEGDAWQFLISADLIVVDFSQYHGFLELLPRLIDHPARVVIDYHCITPAALWGEPKHELLDQGARRRGLVWCADAVITHSRFATGELVQATGLPAGSLRRLPYVIDLDGFQPAPPARSLQQRLGLDSATLLLFVGRVAPNKRVPVLVDALAQLRDVTPPVHAVVIGDTSDVYRAEADRCRQRAEQCQVVDRLHFLGQVEPELMRDAYRSADVFVMPSRHEGCCLPVLEAMASGLPVVAARAAALPETVASAGLTFTPDDAADLACQVRRVLDADAGLPEPDTILRVAVVTWRYGTDFVGGAETSLRTIATALHQAGHRVEVFTTRLRDEHDWTDAGAEGTDVDNGIAVHRFAIDPRDPARFQAAQQRIAENLGSVPADVERDFLAHSIRSRQLLDALKGRSGELDAIIVGPYLFGLTLDVARALPDHVLLLPCFHDEPAARLPALLDAYRLVGGVLFHSEEEQQFGEIELGVNQPRARCLGTVLDVDQAGDERRGLEHVGGSRPYLLYAGRYSPHKNLPLLLEHARRYDADHPDRFTFAFIGQGNVAIPAAPWAKDLAFVDESTRRDLLAGAAAVVQLSQRESLSLVVLEGWAQGVPAIVDGACEVLAGQVRRSGGGRAVTSYGAFAAALDDLWEHPERWQDLGRRGRDHVRAHYGNRSAFVERLTDTVRGLHIPLREHMRRQGPMRVRPFARTAWSEQFTALIDDVLHAPARPVHYRVDVEPRIGQRTVTAGLEALLVPVRIHNRGTHPLIDEGPARTVLRCRVVDEAGRSAARATEDTLLPGLVLPGQTMPAAVRVPVPERPGPYQVAFWAERIGAPTEETHEPADALRLIVASSDEARQDDSGAAFVEAAQRELIEAERLARLPDDYDDVTEGWLARWKRRIKGKLLHNFRRAYVDVLSRQQSAFNRRVLAVLRELAESCAALEHAQQQPQGLQEELARSQRRCAELEARLTRLEALVLEREKVQS